jgi:hypothetical protein
VRRLRRGFVAAALFAGTAALAAAGDVVVLKGGSVIPLKQPWVRRGNTAYLTRADGTLLSVPVSEIDRQATAAASSAPPPPAPAVSAPASTPAEALRSNREGPKARVKITDSDVSHPMDLASATAVAEDKKALVAGAARVEIAGYNQEKDGGNLVVSGQLRNPTQQIAENVNLRVTVIDEKGQPIDAANANLSNGEIETGSTVDFTVKFNVGERIPASFRFAPTWSGPKPTPVPAPAASKSNGGQKAAAPAPTPYGRGSLYAAPAPNAPMQAPADGTGYIPGASDPSNQPKPPTS